MSKVNQDCFAFALFCSVIGPENSSHSLNQSDPKLNNRDVVAGVFPCIWKFGRFYSVAFVNTFVLVLRHSIEKCSIDHFTVMYLVAKPLI